MNVKTQQQKFKNQYQQTLDGLDGSSYVNFQPQIVKELTTKERIISSSFIKGTHLDLKHSLSLNSSKSSSTMLSRNSSSCASSNSNCTASTTMPTIGVNLRVTGQCSQGGRKYMEDFFSVAYQQTENCRDLEYAFIGIYDGHGGAEAATFAKEHLMMEIINQKSFWSDSDQDVLCAIREGYIATHYAMWREQEKWPTTANGLLSTAGTTATIAFIRREKIYIGHVGDSGIVLGYQNENENFWRAKQLTTDHKPESSVERKRIMRSGGKIGVKSGVPRVVWNRPRNAGHRGPTFPNTPVDEIPFLAVARSLGDLWSYNAQLNEFVVSPVPDVQVIRINPKTFRCLIFGTDGLWNVVTSQEAVDTVFKKETHNDRLNSQHQYITNSTIQDGSQWTNPSKALVEEALRAWSGKKMRADNTSVVTVILYPPSNVDNAHADIEQKFSTERAQCQLNYIDVDDNEFSLTLRKQQSFQEIAEKYLPPERFRNFNSFCVNLIDDYQMYYSTDRKASTKSSQLPWCAETEVNDNSTDVESAMQKPRKVQLNLQDFNELLKPHTSITSQMEAAYSSDLYMNSFAETYNSLLDAQIVRSEQVQTHTHRTSTPTPTSIPNNTGLHMQEILQEQQMYQQQCMSGEDGYLLTTLETPREQQRCGELSNIKVYEHIGNESIQPAEYNQMEIERSATTSLEVKLWSNSHDYNYQAQQQQQTETSLSTTLRLRAKTTDDVEIMQPVKHRLLELNSVLQQEQAEEQQVAFEYEQLQQRLKLQKVENVHAHVAQTDMSVSNIELIDCSSSEEDYLLGYETVAPVQLDETVQINEISSSNSMPLFDGADLANAIVKTTDRELQPNELELRDRIVTPTVFMERIEKIEILADKPELVIEAPLVMLPNSTTPATKLSVDTNRQSPQKLRTKLQNKTKSEILLSKAVKSPYFTSQNRNHILNGSNCNKRLRNSNSTPINMPCSLISVPQSQFPNIPNENYRDSNAVTAVTGSSSQRCATIRSNISPNGKEHRQLRSGNLYKSGSSKSNTNVTTISTAGQAGQINNGNSNNLVGVDYYSKRTLRTRNSLTKDLKAKLGSSTNNPNTSSVLKRSVAIATQLMRASRAHSNCAENMKKDTFITAHVINLRSRQVNGQQLKPSATLNSNTRIAVTSRKSRNLRSNPSTNPTDDNSVYSKMTRLQLVGGSTPPAPRLLRAATAVPATRARTTASVQMPTVFRRRSAQRNTTETVTSANSIRATSNAAIRRGSSIARRVKR